MKTNVKIDAAFHEFGNSISCGLLIPYLLKKSGNFNVTVYSKIDFCKEIYNKFCDNFILITEPFVSKDVIETKQNIEAFFNETLKQGLVKIEDIESIPYVGKNRPIKEKYVVFIPIVYRHETPQPHWRDIVAFDFDLCVKIKKFINERGYKVVGFSTNENSTKKELEELSDISFWYDMGGDEIRPVNKVVPMELEWMYFAKTSISLGGAFHIPMTFTVPGIGWDGQVENNYAHFSNILSYKRTDLHYIPALSSLNRNYNLFTGTTDHRKIQEVLYNLIVKKLDIIL